MIKKGIIIIGCTILLGCNSVKSENTQRSKEVVEHNQVKYKGTSSDSIFVDSLLMEVVSRNLPKEERLLQIAKAFVGKPYGVRTLEIADPEQLVVNTRELDCLTLVENVIAFYRVSQTEHASFNGYLRQIRTIRYRGGEMGDYTSRLHYYSDWMSDNAQKNILTNVSRELGGVLMQPEVGFMSKNPSKYKALSKHPEFVGVIAGHETRINSMRYEFIPKDKIEDIQSNIKTGDIIGITTNIKGLDLSHTGIAVNIDDTLYFLHASSYNKKVMLTKKSFVSYTSGIKNQTGIVVLRLK